MGLDPRQRFSKRAVYFAAFRPKYSEALLNYLHERFSFSRRSVIADVGSGTGILTELLLKNGNVVFGVEPKDDMRGIAEEGLSSYRYFRSINGSAESTTLASNSVDFITAAQSFHWFRPIETRKEFRRSGAIQGLADRSECSEPARIARRQPDLRRVPL